LVFLTVLVLAFVLLDLVHPACLIEYVDLILIPSHPLWLTKFDRLLVFLGFLWTLRQQRPPAYVIRALALLVGFAQSVITLWFPLHQSATFFFAKNLLGLYYLKSNLCFCSCSASLCFSMSFYWPLTLFFLINKNFVVHIFLPSSLFWVFLLLRTWNQSIAFFSLIRLRGNSAEGHQKSMNHLIWFFKVIFLKHISFVWYFLILFVIFCFLFFFLFES
jgi:hypothetical protein